LSGLTACRFGFGLYQDEDNVEQLIAGCARVLAA